MSLSYPFSLPDTLQINAVLSITTTQQLQIGSRVWFSNKSLKRFSTYKGEPVFLLRAALLEAGVVLFHRLWGDLAAHRPGFLAGEGVQDPLGDVPGTRGCWQWSGRAPPPHGYPCEPPPGEACSPWSQGTSPLHKLAGSRKAWTLTAWFPTLSSALWA